MKLVDYKSLYGLIGQRLEHSFSQKFFMEKFQRLGLDNHYYALFPLPAIQDLPELIHEYPNLQGLNVTIPYKESVIPYLDEVCEPAARISAVNTIEIGNGRLVGFNTDVPGFVRALKEALGERKIDRALILGSGGASKAVQAGLEMLVIPFAVVSISGKGRYTYDDLTAEVLSEHELIINATPLGMYPETDAKPQLPYSALTARHVLFDLIYNPGKTLFLKEGVDRGCQVTNGMSMLKYQADAAWDIWTKKTMNG